MNSRTVGGQRKKGVVVAVKMVIFSVGIERWVSVTKDGHQVTNQPK